MKMTTRLVVPMTLCLLTSIGRAQTADAKNYQFTISIADYLGASGELYEYEIFRDSLRISFDCDFVNCKHRVIYRQLIGEVVVQRFIQFLSELRLDTLRSRYIKPGLDGLDRAVAIQRSSQQPSYVFLERFNHPTIDALVKEINTLIDDGKFRIRR